MRNEISPTQRRLLDALIADERRSVRELAALCDVSSTSSVMYNLVRLEALGHLERGPCGQARAWRVCNRPDPALAVVQEARKWIHVDARLAAAIREWEAGRG